MSEVLVLQHEACEPLGMIEEALERAGLGQRYVRAQNNDPVPSGIGSAAGLIVMGGPMGVHDQDQFPFLRDELRLIREAVAQDMPVLGVCLGGQLLAHALGAAVGPNGQQEVGWHPVTMTAEAAADSLWHDLPEVWTGFHWHGDHFAVPPGAVSLASSELTPCQAFRSGRAAYGFQFHLEVTEAIICDWTEEFAGELTRADLTAALILDGIPEYLPPMLEIARAVFGRWAALAAREA